MMIGRVVMWVVIMSEFRHLWNAESLVALPIHHDMLTLMATMLIHIECAVVQGKHICRGSRW